MTLKKLAVAAAVFGAVLATASYFSPHWTIYRMRAAIEKRDTKAFSSYADFPSLRESFKRQLAASETGAGKDPAAGAGILDRIGSEITGLVAGPLIDTIVRPAGVMEMLNSGVPGISRQVVQSTITQVPAAGEAMPEMSVAYDGWSRVMFRDARVPEHDGSFVLVRAGLWSWRLAEVELPRQRQAGRR